MVATMERRDVRPRLRFVPHYGDVPPGFAQLLKPLWEDVRTIYKMPTDETCQCCAALDALLLTLFDRGVSLMSMSRAAGRSKTAAQKRVQRISISQQLDLFYSGDDAQGAIMRRNRLGVGQSDYSAWIDHVGDVPAVEKERFNLVLTGKSKISHWMLEDKRAPGYALTFAGDEIPRVLSDMGIEQKDFTQLAHPRDLVDWARASLGPVGDVSQVVAVPSHLLYARGNPNVPQTAREALLSLPEPIQFVVTECNVVRSVLQ
jgi:hypothetical protein